MLLNGKRDRDVNDENAWLTMSCYPEWGVIGIWMLLVGRRYWRKASFSEAMVSISLMFQSHGLSHRQTELKDFVVKLSSTFQDFEKSNHMLEELWAAGKVCAHQRIHNAAKASDPRVP